MAFTLRKAQVNTKKIPENNQQEHINCIIKRFIYKDEESGFYVFAATLPETAKSLKVNVDGIEFAGRQFPVVGTSYIMTQSIVEGQELEIWGNFEIGKQPGSIQFSAKAIQEKIPTKPKAIELFLSSGKIYGVGPKIAKKIVDLFGPKTIEILDNEPLKLTEVEGINLKKIEMIERSWKEWRSLYEIISTMRMYGIGDAAAIKIYNHFKEDSLNKINKDPYELTVVANIGFRTADKIAQQLGKPPNDPKRIEKCILYTLEEVAENGSTACAKVELLNKVNEILNLDISLIQKGLQELVNKGEVIEKSVKIKNFIDKARTQFEIIDLEGVAHSKIHYTEQRIAKELKRIITTPSEFEPEQEMENIESFITENPFDLDDSQLRAARIMLSNKMAILTGGPGTGKTHTIKSLINFFDSINKDAVYYSGKENNFSDFQSMELNTVLSAPTGRAAKRMQEATGKNSSTMHRLLGFKEGEFFHNEFNPLKGDIFIVDESSMIDIWLFCSFLKAVPSHARLIMVGDVDQLHSVSAGKVLKDLIESKIVPVARLKNIHRQAKNSNIILASHAIINHKMPPLYSLEEDSDFVFVEKDSTEEIHDTILNIVQDLKRKKINSENIQILSPKKESEIGTKKLNESLRPLLNDYYSKYEEMESTFITGDRVMQFKNNKELEIFNGDVGNVIYADEETASIYVDFDGRKVEIMGQDIKQLNFSYAVTVHKSQGSDYPYVIIPISKSHSFMWDANLLYTAITRGKTKVILVGDKKTLFHSVASFKQKERITGLKEEIMEAFKEVNLNFLVYEEDLAPIQDIDYADNNDFNSVENTTKPKVTKAFKLPI